MTQEYSEYVAAVVANVSEMVTAIDITKNELLEMIGGENHGSVLRIADETKDEVIQEAYRAAMAPFMSPATEEGAGGESADEDDAAAAGSGVGEEVRGGRQ